MGSQKKSGFKLLDEEEIQRRKFLARCRFKKLFRMVMNNLHWMSEYEPYTGDNVARRIMQATHKHKGQLSISDKALFNKPADERTDVERKYIYRIMGDMKCFRRYPTHVKRKLASRMYFQYYGPGRVVVRENQAAYAMYFVISGDLTVTRQIYDEVLEANVCQHIQDIHQGDTFGDVSLLHHIPRTATVTTADECELLQLLAEDFNQVLYKTVQKEWDLVQSTMQKFTYFENLDSTTTREACIVAKLQYFDKGDIILGDGCGISNHVYFVVKGCVQMLESLQVIITQRGGKNFYRLLESDSCSHVTANESEMDLEKKWRDVFTRHTNVPKTEITLPPKIDSINSEEEYIEEELTQEKTQIDKERHSNAENVEEEQGRVGEEQRHVGEEQNHVEGEQSHAEDQDTKEGDVEEVSSVIEILPNVGSKVLMAPTDAPFRYSIRYSLPGIGHRRTTHSRIVHTYFMQVCRMNTGSTFNFGENMKDRRMLAASDQVICLVFPRVFLFQNNTANIWTRIQHYLSKKIPTKQQLFQEFEKAQKWKDYKKNLVEDVLKHSTKNHPTSIHDVPYSLRMEELYDLCFMET